MRRASRSRSIRVEMCTTPKPTRAVSEAISSVQRLWFRGGISREGTGDLQDYVANGDFGGTLDVSTFLSSFFAFLIAFFSFFACFRSPFVILDIRCGPPLAVMAAWTFRRMSLATNRRHSEAANGYVVPGELLGFRPPGWLQSLPEGPTAPSDLTAQFAFA